jgi:hypothetical protein
MKFLEHLRETRLVPVADVASAGDAVPLAHTLVDAGCRASKSHSGRRQLPTPLGRSPARFPSLLSGREPCEPSSRRTGR